MNKTDYLDYIERVTKKLEENRDYVTDLDAATGDGDHWVNMNMGFQKLIASREALESLSLRDMFKKIGMLIMSTVGGSSGVLYGSAYIKASQAIGDREVIDVPLLHAILEAKLTAIMERGNAKPGYKTMIDPLYTAAVRMKAGMEAGMDDTSVISEMKRGAIEGMEATRAMEAVKGRATYQTGKGVGCLDPGAVTMCYQLELLADSMKP